MSNDRIIDLSPDDLTWLQRAEEHILGVLIAKYGGTAFDRTGADLVSLQRLLEDRSIRAQDVLEAQCVGVVLGNVFVETTSMRWKRVANEYGDMIALHDHTIHFTLYPLTMISKRLEDGRDIDLLALYEDLAKSLNIRR
jgi:hypothetical protein